MSDNQVNVNSEVTQETSSEPISVSAGEAVSFDDIDAVQSNNTNVPNDNRKEMSDKSDKPKKETKNEKDEESSDKEESSKASKSSKSEKQKDNIEKVKKAGKVYKVRTGEKLSELLGDSGLEIERDGKTVPVTIQDLVNSYHGTSEIHRRMTEYDRSKKSLEADRKTVDQFVDKVGQFYRADKPLELIDFLLNTAGLDPATYRMKLYEQIAPEVEQFSLRSPEEKKAYQLELENQYLKRQQTERDKQLASQRELSDVEAQVKQIQAKYSLDDQKFYSLYRELVDEGGFNEAELTPQDIAEYADWKTVNEYVHERILEANPEYADIETLTEQLIDEMSNNASMTLDDLNEIIKEVVADTTDDDLKEKLSEKKNKPKETKNPGHDPLTFDDLM